MSLNTGQVLNQRYRIVKLLAQGGFGAVYRAWDINLKRPCALKENLETSSEAQKQFMREATMLANLSNPNLPRVTDYFIIPRQGQYLIMDYVEGEDLQEMLDRNNQPLPESKVLPWILQICDALTYLHQQNPPIIHRDIKPANIKITPEGKAMLVDFGIAKLYNANLKTTEGARAVTPGYSPIEQYGQGATDVRSDVYALGATLYTALTGTLPPESVQRMVNDQIVPPQVLKPAISPTTADAITRAMNIYPQNRYQTIKDFKTALTFIPATVSVQPTFQAAYVAAQPPQEKTKIIPWLWIGSISGFFLLIIFGFIVMFGLINNNKPNHETTFTTTPVGNTSEENAGNANLAAALTPIETAPLIPTNTSTLSPTSTQAIVKKPTWTHVASTPTYRPTATSVTHTGPAMFVLESNSHCRGGPGTAYEILRDFTRGLTKEIIGRNDYGDWILIKIDDPATRKQLCWISSGNGRITDDYGQISICDWVGDGYTMDQQCTSP